jgi:UDP-N-acetylmuramyl-tripeptide synthetase
LSKSLAALVQYLQPKIELIKPVSPAYDKLEIKGISCDSRKISAGDVFFSVKGQILNGDNYAADAVSKGAVCVFSENDSLAVPCPLIVVKDIQLALALSADFLFDQPSKKLRVIGVTGTNGKTTTTYLVQHILSKSGLRAGLIGTLGARWPKPDNSNYLEEFGQTTPQAPQWQNVLSRMGEDRITHVVMEVSSHALALKRGYGCDFASVCLTNITQDHLDFHKSMEQYWQAKRMLFQHLIDSTQTNKTAVVNLDEPLAHEFLKVVEKDPSIKKFTYSCKAPADISLKSAQFDFSGSHLILETPAGECELIVSLNGPFNVYNIEAALLICLAEGVSLIDCKQALEDFPGVPGRFQIVSSKNGRNNEPLCIVDYAHTPDGLENILKAARALVPQSGKLRVVFGCGGDRDSSKRPVMGEIAERLADEVIVTSDNPRSEDPDKIIAQILTGISKLSAVSVEADRARAIELAIEKASASDVIVIAGKGHENYQILKKETISFDDSAHVSRALLQKQLV